MCNKPSQIERIPFLYCRAFFWCKKLIKTSSSFCEDKSTFGKRSNDGYRASDTIFILNETTAQTATETVIDYNRLDITHEKRFQTSNAGRAEEDKKELVGKPGGKLSDALCLIYKSAIRAVRAELCKKSRFDVNDD